MNKDEYKTLEEIKKLDSNLQLQINQKETEIKILKAEIEQLCYFITKIQEIGEIESFRIEKLKGDSNDKK